MQEPFGLLFTIGRESQSHSKGKDARTVRSIVYDWTTKPITFEGGGKMQELFNIQTQLIPPTYPANISKYLLKKKL